jgi:hypothetical protein
MSDIRHVRMYCYNSCHRNAAKRFSTLWGNDYRTTRARYTVAMAIMLRDSRPYDLHY